MTAQEAQNILELQSPFTTVELKSAHKNALVVWFPAQFMSDRAQLNKALDHTARIHEAYDLLLPLCEAEEEKNANPWLEEAMRHAYGQTPSSSSTMPTVAADLSRSALGEVQTPATPEPAPLLRQDATPAAPTPAANPFLHDIGPLKTPQKLAAEGPKVELRGKSSSAAEHTSAPVSQGGPSAPVVSPVPSRMDPAIKVRPPKVIIAPRLRGPEVQPSMPVATVPVPLPQSLPPVENLAPAPPAVVEPVSPPVAEVTPVLVPAPAPVAVVATPEPEVRVAPGVEKPVVEAAPVETVVPAAPEQAPAPSASPAAEAAPAPALESESKAAPTEASATPSASPAPEPAVAAAAPHVSAALAEEASAAEQANHHAPAPAAGGAVAVAAAAPAAHGHAHGQRPLAKPIPPPPGNRKAKSEGAEDGADPDEPAGDHALVPALGDRYHPAEKEGSPNTDTSRHFPTRPVAPSGAAGKRRQAAENEDASTTTNSIENSEAAETARPARASLSAGQKVLRFFLAALCVAGFVSGIYWVSQTNVGRDPWGMEPGSGGPGERIKLRAFESMKAAAENGNADAQMVVARAYLQGNGVAQNLEEAVTWFRKAAEQGHVDAQYALGDAYKSGSGVPQDNAEALKWYRQAEASREEQREKEEEKEK